MVKRKSGANGGINDTTEFVSQGDSGLSQKFSLIDNAMHSHSLPAPNVKTQIKTLNGGSKYDEAFGHSPTVMENPLYIDSLIAERNMREKKRNRLFQLCTLIAVLVVLIVMVVVSVVVVTKGRGSSDSGEVLGGGTAMRNVVPGKEWKIGNTTVACDREECIECELMEGGMTPGCLSCIAMAFQTTVCPSFCQDDAGGLEVVASRKCTPAELFPQVEHKLCIRPYPECETFLHAEGTDYTQCLWCMDNVGQPDCARPRDEVLPTLPSCLSDDQQEKLASQAIDPDDWQEEYNLQKVDQEQDVGEQLAQHLPPSNPSLLDQQPNIGSIPRKTSPSTKTLPTTTDHEQAQTSDSIPSYSIQNLEGPVGAEDLECSIYWTFNVCMTSQNVNYEEDVIQQIMMEKVVDEVDQLPRYVTMLDGPQTWQEGDCSCDAKVNNNIEVRIDPVPIKADQINSVSRNLKSSLDDIKDDRSMGVKCAEAYPSQPGVVCRKKNL